MLPTWLLVQVGGIVLQLTGATRRGGNERPAQDNHCTFPTAWQTSSWLQEVNSSSRESVYLQYRSNVSTYKQEGWSAPSQWQFQTEYKCVEDSNEDKYTYVRHPIWTTEDECVRVDYSSQSRSSQLLIYKVAKPPGILQACSFQSNVTTGVTCVIEQDARNDIAWVIRNTSANNYTDQWGHIPATYVDRKDERNGSYGKANYIALEPDKLGIARFYTEPLQYVGAVCIRFHYWMEQNMEDTLSVHKLDSEGQRVLHWQMWNESYRLWSRVRVQMNLTDETERVEFEAKRRNMEGDIGIDDFYITEGECVEILQGCEFGYYWGGQPLDARDGSTFCELEQDARDDFNWSLAWTATPDMFTGPRQHHGQGSGYFMYVEVSNPIRKADTARIYTPPLRFLGRVCATWMYSMQGIGISALHLYTHKAGNERIVRWSREGEQSNYWKLAKSTFKLLSVHERVGLEAFKGSLHMANKGDIGIDTFFISTGYCEDGLDLAGPAPTIFEAPWHIAKQLSDIQEFRGSVENCSKDDDTVFPPPYEVHVRHPVQLERLPCNFEEGRYQVSVKVREGGSFGCANDVTSHIIISGSRITTHTCINGSSYDEPFQEFEVYCIGELEPDMIGSRNADKVMIVAHNTSEGVLHFYTLRYTLPYPSSHIPHLVSLQGRRSGRLMPRHMQTAHAAYDDGVDFAFAFHLTYADCLTQGLCANGGTCGLTPQDGGPNFFNCTCPPGFTGSQCEININDCVPEDVCGEHGRCEDLVNAYRCVCEKHYYGDHCENEDNCPDDACNKQGECEDLVDGYRCNCNLPYFGDECEDEDYCYNKLCSNHGRCEIRDNGYVCVCDKGYHGVDCQNDERCPLDVCNGRGKCRWVNGVYICECDDGYSGDNCEDEDNCPEDACDGNGDCVDLVDDYKCLCFFGYEGKDCDKVISCPSVDCSGNGECIELANGYRCQCYVGFIGLDCQYLFEVAIIGYSDALSEGDTLNLTCALASVYVYIGLGVSFAWSYHSNWTQDSIPLLLSQRYVKRNVTLEDAGNYTCRATNLISSGTDTVAVEVWPLEGGLVQQQINERSIDWGIIISLILFFLLLIIIALIVYILVRRRRKQERLLEEQQQGKVSMKEGKDSVKEGKDTDKNPLAALRQRLSAIMNPFSHAPHVDKFSDVDSISNKVRNGSAGGSQKAASLFRHEGAVSQPKSTPGSGSGSLAGSAPASKPGSAAGSQKGSLNATPNLLGLS